MEDVKVKSLYKALKLLDYFTLDIPERGISELAELSGMLKSTVHNIVTTFEKCGFLEKNTDNSKYRLGIKLLELNNTLYMTNDLRKIVRPYMESICEFCNESVYFGIMTEHEVIYLDTVYPKGTIAGKSIIGIKAPLYCTGIGKAILAYLPDEEVNEVANMGMVPFTQNTIIDREKLLDDMAQIRKRGYSIDNMEHEYGIKCVAVPIRNIRDKVVAAISVSGPSLRFTDDKILEYSNIILNISKELKNRVQR